MKFVVTDQAYKQKFAAWSSKRLPYIGEWNEPYKIIGLIDEKEILAAVIYNSFSACDVSMHIAAVEGKRWLTKELLRIAFDYPFNQLKVRRVTGFVPAKNAAALKLDYHLGFKYEGTLRHCLPDDDVIVLGLLKEECRFLGDMNGQQSTSTPSTRSVSDGRGTDEGESEQCRVSGLTQPNEHVRANGEQHLH